MQCMNPQIALQSQMRPGPPPLFTHTETLEKSGHNAIVVLLLEGCVTEVYNILSLGG